MYILSRSSYQTSYPLYAENLWENDGRTFVSMLLIFMVKDFTTSQFSVFNYRKNIINERSNSLMPLWPQMEKTKRWKKRQGREWASAFEISLATVLAVGFRQHSAYHSRCTWMGGMCLCMWRGREGERKTEREMLKEVRCYGLTICRPPQHLFISFNIYFQNPSSQCNNI